MKSHLVANIGNGVALPDVRSGKTRLASAALTLPLAEARWGAKLGRQQRSAQDVPSARVKWLPPPEVDGAEAKPAERTSSNAFFASKLVSLSFSTRPQISDRDSQCGIAK